MTQSWKWFDRSRDPRWIPAGILVAILLWSTWIGGCAFSPSTLFAPSPTPSQSPSPTFTLTHTPNPTSTPTSTLTPSPTFTLTPTLTPSITPTATYAFPRARVLQQANCRYGPGTAYLYSHGFYPDDTAEVHNRDASGTWLWVKPDNLDRHCWVSASVVEVIGDISNLTVYRSQLPHTTFINPPTNVRADREGKQVTVRWNPVKYEPAYDLRGYLIEATVCQNGHLISLAVHTEGTSYTLTDGGNCSGKSGGKLYAVEKHGYTDPVKIPWP